MVNRFKARIIQFFHCLWGSIRFQPHQVYEEEETVDGKLTYFLIGCTCGKKFYEYGQETMSSDEFDKIMNEEEGYSDYFH